MKRTISILLIALNICIIITSCAFSDEQKTAGEGKATVVVSIVPQETFVKAVAGDLVNVVTFIPIGSSPESYAPSPKQLEQISDASTYFCIGVPAEQASILTRIYDINSRLKVLNISDEVANIYPYREFSPGEHDPHVWLSPKRVKIMIDIIQRELTLIDSANANTYKKNAQEYKKRLDKLDSDIKDMLSDVKHNTFVMNHPSLGYFADDYGLIMISLEQEGKAATPKEIQSMVDLAEARNINTIFYQAEADSRQAEAFAREIGGTAQAIAPLSPNYIENLQEIALLISDALK